MPTRLQVFHYLLASYLIAAEMVGRVQGSDYENPHVSIRSPLAQVVLLMCSSLAQSGAVAYGRHD
jgi:cytochrome c oxidase assembly factor CtaG